MNSAVVDWTTLKFHLAYCLDSPSVPSQSCLLLYLDSGRPVPQGIRIVVVAAGKWG